jgi:hypothetical protein
MIRLPGRPWFKPYRFGIGAAPFTWEGWLLTAFYGAGIIIVLQASGILDETRVSVAFGHFLVAMLVLSAVFLVFVWLKTDGPWRWRWGGGDESA